MHTKKNLLGLAVLTTSLALVGCGGSSSSGNQQVDEDTTPDEPTFPAAFAFNQDPTTALDEMKALPEQAFPAELYDFLRTHLIEGEDTSGVSRFESWVTQGDSDPVNTAPPRNCGGSSTTFGTIKTGDGFLAPSTDNTYLPTDVTNDETGTTLGDGSSLYRSAVTVIFTDCEIVAPDDNTTVIATVNGPVTLERTWIGESGARSAANRMDNFAFTFGFDGSDVEISDLDNVDHVVSGTFVDTHVYAEIGALAQQAIGNLPSVSTNFVRNRLAENEYKGMYAFDAPNLSITTTPNGGTSSQVQFNNFASVFVAPTALNNDPQNDVYTVYVETPYRGNETAESSSIVFGTGEDAGSLFIETLSNGGNDKFITADFEFVGAEARFLRGRSNQARLDCPTNATIGYSSKPSAPLVAGISFVLDGNSPKTTRVYVDENNTQTDRDPAVAISTASEDNVCRDGENGPTRFIPLPGLGPITYVSSSPAV
ncbi:hypothetical protein [Marinobacter sp. NSM]|uniref:hypothetical protein n=1 Tax=Marinobacter sp. NSM TaxID=3458004 RepID=UPI0040360467